MIDFLASAGPLAPAVVFLLAAAESAAFVGVAVPGELAVILGGVAAGTGGASLWLMMCVAGAGAIVGDSIGYWLGDRMGPALLQSKRMAKIARRMDGAAALLTNRGWWALVVARFVAVLRAVVPFAAGMGRMPYRRFLLGNVIGGIAWATTFTLVGYTAGANYPTVERWIRTGGLAVLGLGISVGLIVWLTRWAQRNRARLARSRNRVTEVRPVKALLRMMTATTQSGLSLAVIGGAIVAGIWLFGGLMQDVLGSDEFFFLDIATMNYLAKFPTKGLVTAAKVVDAITSPAVLTVGLSIAVVSALMTRRRRLAVALCLAAAGQWLIVELSEALVHRIPPAVSPLIPRVDYGFPSEHVALVVAIGIVAAWPWSHPGWTTTVTRFGIVLLFCVLVGAARVILLVEFPSDAFAAIGVAGGWALLACLVSSAGAQQTSPRAASG